MARWAQTVSRAHAYVGQVGYSTALASSGRRIRSHVRLAQLSLIKRWSPVIAVDAQGMRIFVDTHDVGVARQIVLHGAYEADTILSAVRVLEHADRHPFAAGDMTFLDVGANIGTAIIQAVCSHGAAGGTAYEPHPGNIALLRHNLLANQIADRVSAVQCAVTDSCGEVTLERSPNNSGDHRVRTDAPPIDRFGSRVATSSPFPVCHSTRRSSRASSTSIAWASCRWIHRGTRDRFSPVRAGCAQVTCRSCSSTGRTACERPAAMSF